MSPNYTHKIFHSKISHKQKEKKIHRMGENICKQCIQEGINLQNLQTARSAQCQKNKQPNKKVSRRPK